MAQDTLHSAAFRCRNPKVFRDHDICERKTEISGYMIYAEVLVRLYPVADEDRGCEEEAFHHDSIVMPSPDRRN